jgi:hypothetical protein
VEELRAKNASDIENALTADQKKVVAKKKAEYASQLAKRRAEYEKRAAEKSKTEKK